MSTYRSMLLTGAMVVGLASEADAAIFLRASVSSDGGLSYTELSTANDAGSPGQAMLDASGSGITLSIQTATGNPVLPFPGFSIEGSAFHEPGQGARTLLLEFSQTGVPTASGSNMLMSAFALPILQNAGAVIFTSYADSGNVAFGTQQLLSQDVFTATGAADEAVPFNAPGLTYAQTVTMQINFLAGGGGAFAGSAQISSPIPEPATLGLLAAGLLGLGFAAHRRKAA